MTDGGDEWDNLFLTKSLFKFSPTFSATGLGLPWDWAGRRTWLWRSRVGLGSDPEGVGVAISNVRGCRGRDLEGAEVAIPRASGSRSRK